MTDRRNSGTLTACSLDGERMNQFILTPVPVDGVPDGNEHRLSVPECLMLRRVIVVELREDVLARLKAAIPELTPSGNRCALGRAPTDDEVARLRAASEWYGFPLVATVRTNEAYANERRLWAARRNGKWER